MLYVQRLHLTMWKGFGSITNESSNIFINIQCDWLIALHFYFIQTVSSKCNLQLNVFINILTYNRSIKWLHSNGTSAEMPEGWNIEGRFASECYQKRWIHIIFESWVTARLLWLAVLIRTVAVWTSHLLSDC